MEIELNYDIRKISPKEQEEVRKKIVREMKKRGDANEVAEICECTVRHVNKTWKKYKDGGVKAILASPMGRPKGKCCKLNPEQESKIKKLITDKTPEESGMSGYLWDRKTVVALVKLIFGIDMPLSTMGDYLAKWNFTYQRPKKSITNKMIKQ